MRNSTICLLVQGDPPHSVLLGYKKVRFGAGKFTGFGGSVEPGETVSAAAVREMREESNITVSEEDLVAAGRLTFLFPDKPAWNQIAHLFIATTWEGQPIESEEMSPVWFPVAEIPYDRMWQDASYWLPRILTGQRICARFTFLDDCETVDTVQVQPWNIDDS